MSVVAQSNFFRELGFAESLSTGHQIITRITSDYNFQEEVKEAVASVRKDLLHAALKEIYYPADQIFGPIVARVIANPRNPDNRKGLRDSVYSLLSEDSYYARVYQVPYIAENLQNLAGMRTEREALAYLYALAAFAFKGDREVAMGLPNLQGVNTNFLKIKVCSEPQGKYAKRRETFARNFFKNQFSKNGSLRKLFVSLALKVDLKFCNEVKNMYNLAKQEESNLLLSFHTLLSEDRKCDANREVAGIYINSLRKDPKVDALLKKMVRGKIPALIYCPDTATAKALPVVLNKGVPRSQAATFTNRGETRTIFSRLNTGCIKSLCTTDNTLDICSYYNCQTIYIFALPKDQEKCFRLRNFIDQQIEKGIRVELLLTKNEREQWETLIGN